MYSVIRLTDSGNELIVFQSEEYDAVRNCISFFGNSIVNSIFVIENEMGVVQYEVLNDGKSIVTVEHIHTYEVKGVA